MINVDDQNLDLCMHSRIINRVKCHTMPASLDKLAKDFACLSIYEPAVVRNQRVRDVVERPPGDDRFLLVQFERAEAVRFALVKLNHR